MKANVICCWTWVYMCMFWLAYVITIAAGQVELLIHKALHPVTFLLLWKGLPFSVHFYPIVFLNHVWEIEVIVFFPLHLLGAFGQWLLFILPTLCCKPPQRKFSQFICLRMYGLIFLGIFVLRLFGCFYSLKKLS